MCDLHRIEKSMRNLNKYDLHQVVRDLGLSHDIKKLFERSRPLHPGQLRLIEDNIGELRAVHSILTGGGGKDTREVAVAICCDTFAGIARSKGDWWTATALTGIAALQYLGRWTPNQAYRALCLGAGSCLRRSKSEPFRTVLSFITAAGFQPERWDESLPVKTFIPSTDERWWDRGEVFLGLASEVKGAPLVGALCAGLAVGVAGGEFNNMRATGVFMEIPYRHSNPLTQLVKSRGYAS